MRTNQKSKKIRLLWASLIENSYPQLFVYAACDSGMFDANDAADNPKK